MRYWTIEDGERRGPFTDYELRSRIREGELTPETPGWREGLGQWTALGHMDVFRSDFAAARGEPADSAPDDASDETETQEPFPSEAPPGDPGQPGASHPTFPQRVNRDNVRAYLREVGRYERRGQDPTPQEERSERQIIDQLAPPPLRLVRRFLARWMDLGLYSCLWWLMMWAGERDIAAILKSPWIMAMQYIPWFALEAWMLHRFGTTPGKWLLGLRVVNRDGSPLGAGQASWRSFRVLVGGIGFGWPVLSVLCQLFSWIIARRKGAALWDLAGGHQVQSEPSLSFLRLSTLALIFFVSAQLRVAVLFPYVMPAILEKFPELRESYEKNPPWQLPRRDGSR